MSIRRNRLRLPMVRVLEVSAWVLGVVLLAMFVHQRATVEIERKHALATFEEARQLARPNRTLESTPQQRDSAKPAGNADAEMTGAEQPLRRPPPSSEKARRLAATALDTPDMARWSAARRRAFMLSLPPFAVPEAVLRIPAIQLEAPVYPGTDEQALSHGLGRIKGTSAPQHGGKTAIAGHRDGLFRALKEVATGDVMVLETLTQRFRFRVHTLSVVEPTDVHVLAPNEEHTLTLVTCYPFYHVGPAPKRFVVTGDLVDASAL